jgi:conjugal transfer pilus assembly protein TrbC
VSASRRLLEAGVPALLLAAPPLGAEPPSTVTDADVARASRSQLTISEKDIERARRRYRMPSDAELARVPIPRPPNLDALPAPVTPKALDLESIAKGYEALATPPMSAASAGPRLLVFVSFAMPEPTFTRLVEQAARAGAKLYIRGLVDGSLKQTVQRAQRLIGAREVAIQIDPRVFDRYAVTVTPTFVLVRHGATEQDCPAGQCVAPEDFVSVAGDVTVEYALEFVARTAPRFTGEAALLLKRLKG